MGHLSRGGSFYLFIFFFYVAVIGVCVVANGGTFSLFADPHAFECHLHLVNRADLETILRAEGFVNEGDQ